MITGHLPELIIVLVIALVIFGPKRLPEIGGSLGKGIREFRRSTSGEDDEPVAQIKAPPDTTVEVKPAPAESEVQH
ncbi:MAG TPA: twin-arginine translocase TatA/TatE family subunit [Chloroflexota bacterium]|nr:twin-arginine translocase TatA/TatE family subunit [Chloroflexota bacterium]